MFYSINRMARMLGVTTHTLRYYEKRGLIEPHTNASTKYRSYSVLDTRRFNACRMYRAFGLSLAECRDVMQDKQHSPAFWKPLIAAAVRDVGQVKTIQIPALYRLTVAEKEQRLAGRLRDQYFCKWLELLPVATWASRIPQHIMTEPGKDVEYDYGLIMPEQFVLKYDLHHPDITEYITGGTYLYTVFEKDTDLPFTLDFMSPLYGELERQNLKIDGAGLSNCLFTGKRDGRIVNYHYYMVRTSGR